MNTDQDDESGVPQLTEASLEWWLELLADGELAAAERRQLLEYLEQHPQHWRQCALTLWDQQGWLRAVQSTFDGSAMSPSNAARPAVLRGRAMTESRATPNPLTMETSSVVVGKGAMGENLKFGRGAAIAHDRRQRSARGIGRLLALTAVLSLGLGCLISWITTQGQVTQLSGELRATRHYLDRLQGELIAEQALFRSLPGIFPDQPCLIEIESTPDRTVYLTDGSVSEDLIRGLLAVGQVEVRPYQPAVETGLWRSLVRPVVAIEVVKDSYLLAQGEF